jgi:hypothetical protein
LFEIERLDFPHVSEELHLPCPYVPGYSASAFSRDRSSGVALTEALHHPPGGSRRIWGCRRRSHRVALPDSVWNIGQPISVRHRAGLSVERVRRGPPQRPCPPRWSLARPQNRCREGQGPRDGWEPGHSGTDQEGSASPEPAELSGAGEDWR